MSASVQDRISALTQRMLKKKLYVVLSTPIEGGAEKLLAQLPAHLEYMIANEKKGVVFASGPLSEADGGQSGRGLTVLRAASREDAEKIAEQDPYLCPRRAQLRGARVDSDGRLLRRHGEFFRSVDERGVIKSSFGQIIRCHPGRVHPDRRFAPSGHRLRTRAGTHIPQ